MKNKKPRVSVIMGVHNGGEFLVSAINSILNQTFSDLEFIIVDDGSNDGTASILSSFDDDRLVIIQNSHNIGLTKSLNKALQIANGEYIARQDADDISHPNRLKQQIYFLENNSNFAMLGCQAELIDKDDVFLENINVDSDPEIIKSKLIRNNQFVHGSVLMRRSVLNDMGGYREKFRYTQDYDLWLRMSENYDLCNLPEKLYFLRRVSSSISLKNFDLQLAFAMLARVFFVERQENKVDSYHWLNPDNPEKLIYSDFPHSISGLVMAKFTTSINLAKEAEKCKKTKDEVYWLKMALISNWSFPSLIHVFKIFLLPRIYPIISLYRRHISWRFNSN